MQIKCRLCGGKHKNRDDKFPYVFRDKEGKIVGYACKKCVMKYRKEEMKKQEKREFKMEPKEEAPKPVPKRGIFNLFKKGE